MPITVVPINGNSLIINYADLQEAFEEFLGDKCTEATMYVYNRFPVPVSSEAYIDLLFLICIHDKSGIYTKKYPKIGGGTEYFKNTIIPVTIQSQSKNFQIRIQDDEIILDSYEYDANEDFSSIKFGLLDFFEKRCGMDRSKLFFDPIQLIINNHSSGHFKNYIYDSEFNPRDFFKVIKSDPEKYFRSYGPWTKDIGYTIFENTATDINNAISDFTEFGYLTKRKIERIGRQLTNSSSMYDSIGIQPTSINGKAGTGKTSHLLHLLIRSLKNNNNVTFLTYNQLLTKNIAFEVNMIQQNLYKVWKAEGKDPQHFAKATVQTLMRYTYHLSKKLGVLHLMTEERIKEIESVLKESIDFLLKNLPLLIKTNSSIIFANNQNNWDTAVECVQNAEWPVSTKQYGIAFIRYLQKNAEGLTQKLPEYAKQFFGYKIEQLKEIDYQNMFLRDYNGCLKNTLKVIRDTEGFYNQYDVNNKFDLLDSLMNLRKRKQDEELTKGFISLEKYKERVRNVLKGRVTKGSILMLDEAQDCHSYEREIFYEIFKPKNVVISHGGQEQLIRYSELCHWDLFRSKKIDIKKIGSGNKSYRIKQAILDFCNFIADKHDIYLNLKSFSSEDPGHIIFDFRDYSFANQGNIFSDLLERGKVNDCSPLESLMVFDINKKKKQIKGNDHGNGTGVGSNSKFDKMNKKTIGVINEYNVLNDEVSAAYQEFPYLKKLIGIAQFWNGAKENKQKLSFPSSNEVRIINYESCRGLEAWCVICFNIDAFYYTQTKKDEAERYLLHEGLVISKETRAAMYAITWVLMAATRAIDSLYLQLSHPENDLYKLCKDYAGAFPQKCTIYKN